MLFPNFSIGLSVKRDLKSVKKIQEADAATEVYKSEYFELTSCVV